MNFTVNAVHYRTRSGFFAVKSRFGAHTVLLRAPTPHDDDQHNNNDKVCTDDEQGVMRHGSAVTAADDAVVVVRAPDKQSRNNNNDNNSTAAVVCDDAVTWPTSPYAPLRRFEVCAVDRLGRCLVEEGGVYCVGVFSHDGDDVNKGDDDNDYVTCAMNVAATAPERRLVRSSSGSGGGNHHNVSAFAPSSSPSTSRRQTWLLSSFLHNNNNNEGSAMLTSFVSPRQGRRAATTTAVATPLATLRARRRAVAHHHSSNNDDDDEAAAEMSAHTPSPRQRRAPNRYSLFLGAFLATFANTSFADAAREWRRIAEPRRRSSTAHELVAAIAAQHRYTLADDTKTTATRTTRSTVCD